MMAAAVGILDPMARTVQVTDESIREAAAILRRGGLVAFPTETVYGLGANALDPDAVAGIFRAKGRPAANPLIVHIADPSELVAIAESNGSAEILIHAFWPGPLTLVLPKRDVVPGIVTAGGSTVAIRMPDHPVALQLLAETGLPLAAPSANRSESLSPTRAEHVAEALGESIELILDGGPCRVGLESTVIDLTSTPPCLLRHGMISPRQIFEQTGIIVGEPPDLPGPEKPARSPGQMQRHYAPRTPLTLHRDLRVALGKYKGRAGLLFCGDIPSECSFAGSEVLSLPLDPRAYAEGLYSALHALDRARVEAILVQEPPNTDAWRAIWDRLTRAAAQPAPSNGVLPQSYSRLPRKID